MIKCICIDDKKRPKEIPKSKWVKKGEVYTVIFALIISPQNTLAVQLDEIDLDESCAPYDFFLAERFAFDLDDFEKLINFVENCIDVNVSIKEMMEQININERTTDTVEENQGVGSSGVLRNKVD